jgi:precorrin-6B methylase 1
VRPILVAGALLALLLLTAWGAATSWRRGSPAATIAARALPTDRGATLTYVALGDSTVVGVGASHPENGYVPLLVVPCWPFTPSSLIFSQSDCMSARSPPRMY